MGCSTTTEDPPLLTSQDEDVNLFHNSISHTNFTYKYVVIGAGNAAGYAAKEFVDSGKLKPRELCIIGDEPVLPLERPALTKGFMRGEAKLPGFNTCASAKERHEQDWYDQHGIVLMTNTTVSDVDLQAKVIKTQDGKNINYQKCLAATGARPVYLTDFKVTGADLDGLYYIRSWVEAKALLTRLEEAKNNEEVVIVGGGYIGTEMAAAMIHHGLTNIKMVFPEETVVERVFPPEIAKVYENALTSRGVELLKSGKMVSGFEGKDGKVDTVCLKDGEKLHADLVVVGVGARPNMELFTDKVETEKRGIKVDGQMKSSVDDFYACGDLATFPILCHEETNRLEHVRAARATAMQAARSMMGFDQSDLDFLPVFYSNIFNFRWEMVGKKTDNALIFGLGETRGSKFGCVWLYDDNRLSGVLLDGGSGADKKKIADLARKQEAVPAELLESDASEKLLAYVLA